ncbi:hypothetical protein ACSBR2_012748 [Camellia fascicularis]
MGDEFNNLFGEELTHFSKNCKFFRVTHFVGIGYDKREPKELPKEIGNLILLRYLGLRRTGFPKLPSSIGNLRYLQTLDLHTTDEISVPNVLWKMKGLIHLYLPYYNEFSTQGKLRLDGLSNLETLENLASDKIEVRGLFKLTNLRRIKNARMQGNLEDLTVVNNYLLNNNQLQHTSITIENCDFCSEDGLSLLRQLLGCDCLVLLNIYGAIDPMVALEKLPHLRTLHLYNAFVGKEIVCSAHGFPHFNRLELCNLEIEEWRVDDGAMPNLSCLWIVKCKNLKTLQDGLIFISTLQELQIWYMPKTFSDKLQVVDGQEGEDFHKRHHIPSIHFAGK